MNQKKMVHPSDILRTDSDDESCFSAPKNVVRRNPIDCGISALPCFTNWCNLEKFAKPGVFMCLISALGLLQGTIYSYFRGTANTWMKHYNFSHDTVDWLLYSNDILIGILAFVVGYWGNRFHRASWLGSLAIFQAIACTLLIVPEIYRSSYFSSDTKEVLTIPICQRHITKIGSLGLEDTNYAALILLYTYQLFFALTMVSLITHGLTYLDDNVKKKSSAAYLCVVLASFQLGKQLGMYSTWITIQHFLPNTFLTPMWLILSGLTLIVGVLITMFPYELPSVVMRKMVASILVLANGEEEEVQIEEVRTSFWTSFMRILTNKILMVNVYATLFLHGALINFDILQSEYYRSRFYVHVSRDLSGYQDSWLVQILTNLMKQPFVVLAIISTGMVIAKVRPSAKKIAIFNVCISAATLTLFSIYGFLQCDAEIKSEYKNKLSMFYCNNDCACSANVPFYPVCTEGKNTYFSPCHAGCSKIREIDGYFEDCSCGGNIAVLANTTASIGACNSNDCTFLWALAQVNGITITALVATTTITNLLINLRSVKREDKAMSMALEATLIGILPYFPLRLIFAAFEDYFCLFYNPDQTCKLHSKDLGIFVTTITAVFVAIAIVLYAVVIYLVRDMKLYAEKEVKTVERVERRTFSINPFESARGEELHEELREHFEKAAEKARQPMESSF